MQTNAPSTASAISAPVKIAVVGAGNVGASFAYALLLSGIASEIVIIDANRAKAEGEAMDLAHSAPFAPPVRVRVGDYSDCAGAVVTVVTAGANQKPGETRLQLLEKNAGIFQQIIPAVVEANPTGVLLIATNPVDVLTALSLQLSGLPTSRVMGSGTILDTARFRHFIGSHVGVAPQNVDAYIIGEHGDSEVAVWSQVQIGGVPLDDFCAAAGIVMTQEHKDEIFRRTHRAAYDIIERKGATYYAIGAGLVDVVAAIVRDENRVLPVASVTDGVAGISGIAFGMPTIVNRDGASRVLPLPLSESEQEALFRSADVLRTSLSHVQQA
ncbi:L-lactate dehydrogenase [bacterium]|nr:MAG: L-lactate dehydrogenase [bacterium]